MSEKTEKAPEQQQRRVQHIDLPELSETFADSIDLVYFDGQTLRINFAVTRLEQTQSPSARRYPSCRLVLTPTAAVELMNQIQKLMAGMIQAGVLKPGSQLSPESKPDTKPSPAKKN